MADVDDQIQLASQIAREIVQRLMSTAKSEKDRQELKETSRNEWMKWLQVVKARGLDDAIHYAQQLSRDVTVRPNIRTINEKFAESVDKYKARLLRFSAEGQRLSLSYIAWWLRILATESQLSALDSREVRTDEKSRAQKTSPKWKGGR